MRTFADCRKHGGCSASVRVPRAPTSHATTVHAADRTVRLRQTLGNHGFQHFLSATLTGNFAAPTKEEPKKAEEKATPAGKQDFKPLYPDCDPKPATYDQVQAAPGAKPGFFGFTSPHLEEPTNLALQFQDGKCSVKWSEAKLSFPSFLYTKPGTYKVGTRRPDRAPCKDKTTAMYVVIKPEVSERIRQAEIEHCYDAHFAFELSYARYNKAVSDLGAGFATTGEKCQDEIIQRLSRAAGLEFAKWFDVGSCLWKTLGIRDGKGWHHVELGTAVFDDKCTTATYTPDEKTVLPELWQHPANEIVKGCGEKP